MEFKKGDVVMIKVQNPWPETKSGITAPDKHEGKRMMIGKRLIILAEKDNEGDVKAYSEEDGRGICNGCFFHPSWLVKVSKFTSNDVGKSVRVKNKQEIGKIDYFGPAWIQSMDEDQGKTFMITCVNSAGQVELNTGHNHCIWKPEWLEKVHDEPIDVPCESYQQHFVNPSINTAYGMCTVSVGSTNTEELLLTKTFKTKLMNIKSKIKMALTPEPTKTLIKEGVLDENQELTTEGRQLFHDHLWDKFGAEFAAKIAPSLTVDEDKK